MELNLEQTKLDILSYKSYRAFVQDWFLLRKSRRSFSYRQFSSLLGLSSPNYLQLVMKGERNLSHELAIKVAEAMKLTHTETEYFLNLVELEHCSTPAQKKVYEKKLLKLSRHLHTSLLGEAQKEIVEGWQHMLIRELVFLPDFKMDISWMESKVDQLISIDEIERSIELLVRAGHWYQNELGKWTARDGLLDTGDSILQKQLMNEHHAATLKKWSEILSEVDPRLREVGLIHIPINHEKIPELKTRIQNFQDEIIGWLQSEKNADMLVQLGTYLVPFKRSK